MRPLFASNIHQFTPKIYSGYVPPLPSLSNAGESIAPGRGNTLCIQVAQYGVVCGTESAPRPPPQAGPTPASKTLAQCNSIDQVSLFSHRPCDPIIIGHFHVHLDSATSFTHRHRAAPISRSRDTFPSQSRAPPEVPTRPPPHGFMATTQNHFARNASLNRNGSGNGKGNHVAQRPAEDDDSIVTEDFPEFDPSHDGSEEDSSESSGSEHYTHTATEERNGARIHGAKMNGFAANDGEATTHEHQQNTPINADRPLFPVEPEPEPAHARGDDHIHTAAGQNPPTMTSPITSPPYWAHGHTFDSQSTSRANNLSTESLVPGGITLQDNEADESNDPRQRNSEETRTSYGRDRNKACWAKSVEVTNYVIVNGSATNIGAFVVWNIRVQTLQGPYMNIRKRYSEFDDFRRDLIRTFPSFEAAVPVLPPKSVISRFRPRFLEKRRAGLQYFLK